MRIYADTEFHEDGRIIDPISIGLVREDGAELYLESMEFDERLANDWVKANVLPHLQGFATLAMRSQIRDRVREFVGDEKPEFWAYYADYDWIVICQLFGRMIDLPYGWPMYCRDLKQYADEHGLKLPKQETTQHNALEDARWLRSAHVWAMDQVALAAENERRRIAEEAIRTYRLAGG